MPMPAAAIDALAAAALACAVCVALIASALRTGLANRLLDRPNERSLHVKPTPRAGGLGILAGLAVAGAALRPEVPAGVWIAVLAVAAVSLLDDLRGLSAAVRLPLHLAAAALCVGSTLGDAPAAVLAASVFGLAWMVNLYNFMDGSDGLAGGQAVFGFGATAVAALQAGEPGLAVAAASVAGGAAGFLVFNLPPARIFMGDVGSTSLGLLAGGLGALGVARGAWGPAFPVLAFLPFVLDASLTLLDRLRRGCRIWQAHREHAYQRLNLGGFGHRRTATLYGALMAVSAAVALAANRQAAGGIAAAVWTIILVVLYGMTLRWRGAGKADPRSP